MEEPHRRILRLEDRTPRHSTRSTYRDHNRSHNRTLLHPRSLIVSIRQRRRDVTLSAPGRKEEPEVAGCGGLGVQDEEEPDDGDEGLADEDGPAQADSVGKPGCCERGEDGEDVGWRGEELRFGIAEAHALA